VFALALPVDEATQEIERAYWERYVGFRDALLTVTRSHRPSSELCRWCWAERNAVALRVPR
jgi:hypothetical protein